MNYNSYNEIPVEQFNINDLYFHHQQPSQPTGAPEGKISVRVCCEITVGVFEGLREFNPTKEEFEFFMNSFHKHRTADEYCRKRDGSFAATIEKVILRASTLRPELRSYYLQQFRSDVIKRLSDHIDLKVDFQANFDNSVAEAFALENKSNELLSYATSVRLNQNKKGIKTNMLRVLDALWELRYFTDEEGEGTITRSALIMAVGELFNEDFSNFESILSQSYNNTSMETNLAIFDEMKAKIQQKCIPK